VDILELGKVFSEKCRFPLSVSFHQCSINIFSYKLLLPEEQRGEARKIPESTRCPLDRKVLSLVKEKNRLNATKYAVFAVFIASTCFEHQYAHHQE
jgi:hypothetical protein